jgi:hypothetical protein
VGRGIVLLDRYLLAAWWVRHLGADGRYHLVDQHRPVRDLGDGHVMRFHRACWTVAA